MTVPVRFAVVAAGLVTFGKSGLVVLDGSNGETLRNYSFHKSPRNVEGATPIVLGTRI